MRSWYRANFNRFAIFAISQGPVPLVVPEAVLDTDNDPGRIRQNVLKRSSEYSENHSVPYLDLP
jgi:hypothetical protein